MPHNTAPFMVTIAADGSVTVTHLDSVPGLAAIKAALDGGYLEVVPAFITYPGGAPCVAFCDEEGKLKGLPVNRVATRLWAQALGYVPADDVLVGPIVIVVGPQSFLAQL